METLTNKRQHAGGHKKTLTSKRRRRSDSPPPPAAGPGWLILNSCTNNNERGDSSIADAKTSAASWTSFGKPFSISFGIAAPPACCSLHCDWLGGGTPGDDSEGKHSKSGPDDVRIIAGHDDALLIEIRVPNPKMRRHQPTFDDYFLYEAGCGGARPPSLSLLPVFKIPVQSGYRNHQDPTPKFRYLDMNNTGILRRADDDLVVCQYEMTCDPPVYGMAELCMLRLRIGCDHKWIVRRVPIVEQRKGSSELQPWRWRLRDLVAHAVVPVGNRFLCWVDYSTGFIVCDMAEEEIPKLRYVPLPGRQHDGYCGHYPREMRAYCTLGGAAGGPGAVRFVRVSPPRCCCGDVPGKTTCEGSSSSFNVTSWTMTLTTPSTGEATTWVKDVVLDCDEMWKWQLPSYGCLPHDKHLEYPMVSSDDPDVIYFKVEGLAVAMNTRSKKLLSVVHSGVDQHLAQRHPRSIMTKLCW